MSDKPRARFATITQADGARLSLDTIEHHPDPVDWVLEDVTGWYGGSGVRRQVADRYGHGSFMGPGFRDARYMTVKGSVRCSNTIERDWQERSLSGILGDGGLGTLWVDDGETQLHSIVGLDGAPQVVRAGTHALVFQIPLISESPYLVSDEREITLFPPGSGVGFEFPPFSRDLGQGPVITFGTEVQETAYVWNDGNAASPMIFTVVADTAAGFIVGHGRHRVTYPWPTYKNVPVQIDMAGAVRIGGVDQTHRVGERGWAAVEPGTIETPFLRFIDGGTGWATVGSRDTYI